MKSAGYLIMIYALSFMLMVPHNTSCQNADSTDVEAVAEEDMAVDELISPSMDFSVVQNGNNSVSLESVLRARVKGTLKKLALLKVTFYSLNDDEEKELGFGITDSEGRALFNAREGTFAMDTEGNISFKAVFAGNKAMEGTEEELTFKRAKIEIIPVKEDSLLTLNVKISDLSSEKPMPIPEVIIGIYVKRHFKNLKIGEIETDENGEGSIEFPNNLPGDQEGNLVIISKLDDDDTYGMVESSISEQWGIPLSAQISKTPRTLWSPDPPLWMIVTFIVLMVTVWGHYLVIIYELFRLRKEEPSN